MVAETEVVEGCTFLSHCPSAWNDTWLREAGSPHSPHCDPGAVLSHVSPTTWKSLLDFIFLMFLREQPSGDASSSLTSPPPSDCCYFLKGVSWIFPISPQGTAEEAFVAEVPRLLCAQLWYHLP